MPNLHATVTLPSLPAWYLPIMKSSSSPLFVAVPVFLVACNAGVTGSGGGGAGTTSSAESSATGTTSVVASTTSTVTGFGSGASVSGAGGAETCVGVTEEAVLEHLPVDIIWMVDNSSSMEPAVAEVKAGLNDFAALISASNLDYKVILLSKRGTSDLSVCIPQPLAGDDACGNGPRFFHSSIDVLSTQPLEQFLGTLGQTAGYTQGEQRGGEPWAQELRPEATKTIVVVTDDNARLSATQFKTFAGGQNPFNSLTLPPGILDPSWNGLFDGFLFSAIYGWGDAQDPTVICEYPDMTSPPSSGATYTTLVSQTGGVRAQICDGAGAWTTFFDAVAQAVVTSSQVSCVLEIPPPPGGETLDFGKVNVRLVSGAMETLLPNVGMQGNCAAGEGWYYDDPAAPTHVVLCPASCDHAQQLVGPNQSGKVEVLFGCTTIVK